jgi:DNA sulfur modification protein DndE
MTWRTFGGSNEAVYKALLKERCLADGLDATDATLTTQFRLHLHRGIGYLAGDSEIRSIRGLLQKAVPITEDGKAR